MTKPSDAAAAAPPPAEPARALLGAEEAVALPEVDPAAAAPVLPAALPAGKGEPTAPAAPELTDPAGAVALAAEAPTEPAETDAKPRRKRPPGFANAAAAASDEASDAASAAGAKARCRELLPLIASPLSAPTPDRVMPPESEAEPVGPAELAADEAPLSAAPAAAAADPAADGTGRASGVTDSDSEAMLLAGQDVPTLDAVPEAAVAPVAPGVAVSAGEAASGRPGPAPSKTEPCNEAEEASGCRDLGAAAATENTPDSAELDPGSVSARSTS